MIVLVVDDIPLNRDIAVALLVKENCKCDVAVDGVEAVAAVKQKSYPYYSYHCPLLLDIVYIRPCVVGHTNATNDRYGGDLLYQSPIHNILLI